VAFAGTPAAAVPSLQACLESRHEVVAVITRAPKPAGRGRRPVSSPVAQLASDAGVPLLTPARAGDPAFLEELRALDVHACPVVAYGALLPPAALDVPRFGWINLHFSLLPAWRGAAPVQHAILHGDEITGASTFLIEQGLDTGPVYGVVTESIRPTDTAGDLLERLAQSGAHLLVATLDGVEAGTLEARPQPAEGVSIAGKLTPDDARVDWNAPAQHVDRLIRACTPAPGAWTSFRGQRLGLGPVRPGERTGLAPGELRAERHAVRVGTATGDVSLGHVQPAGKRPMAAADWARGARIAAGERFDGAGERQPSGPRG
jgi:methionyl-tRNA formyltransferase